MATGQITTKAPLDHDTKSRYTVTVTATDPSLARATITVAINVTDVNEKPVFTAWENAITYAENGTGTVATYRATDPEGISIDWILAGTDDESFTITGGALKFKERS